jgi:hypothetical protein
MTDAEPVGRRRTTGPVLTSHVPVRFPPEMIEAVKTLADQDGMTVSSWIRQVIRLEIQRREQES